MIPKIIPFLLLVILIGLFVMPETILQKIPRALEMKHYIQENISRILKTGMHMFRVIVHNVQRVFFAARDIIQNLYQTVLQELRDKLNAVRDVVDALNRLRD